MMAAIRPGLRWLPALAWMGVIFALSSQSHPPRPHNPFLALLAYTAAHFLAYAVLAALLHWPLRSAGRGRAGVLAFLLAAAYGISDELHQSVVPHRVPSLFDWLTDLAGAAWAVWSVSLLTRQRQARRWQERGIGRSVVRAVGAMASPQAERLAQLQTMRTEEIDAIVAAVRRAETVPALQRHFEKQGQLLGARMPEEYVRLFREHVRRQDLRVFTYIRPSGKVPMWEFVAPDTGTTVMYNERRRSIWSFFRPRNATARMRGVQTNWIEAVQTPDGWRFVEDWIWPS
ncbi:MAG: VanZ family protein [Chloroflexi bacterium]|nr:VanZ family protein [Chloroflexota bacterium]